MREPIVAVAGEGAQDGKGLQSGSEQRMCVKAAHRPLPTLPEKAPSPRPTLECVLSCPGLEGAPHVCRRSTSGLPTRVSVVVPSVLSRLPPVETVQRNPELVLEGGPLAPLPPGDGFLETSIPVPALTCQDGPRPSPDCAECV